MRFVAGQALAAVEVEGRLAYRRALAECSDGDRKFERLLPTTKRSVAAISAHRGTVGSPKKKFELDACVRVLVERSEGSDPLRRRRATH